MEQSFSKTINQRYDAIIIGAGSAGLTGALELTELGKKVLVLDKMPKPGGNSMRASSGMNAAQTDVQEAYRIADTYGAFYDETLAGGGFQNDPKLLHYFVTHATSAVSWLKAHHVVLDELALTGGMSVKRTHRPSSAPAIGAYLIKTLVAELEEYHVPIICETTVIHLEQKEPLSYVVTVKTPDGQVVEVIASAILLATGGFAANQKMVATYRPDLAQYKTTNHTGATGDGLSLGATLGAQLVDMTQIQVHPTVNQDQDHAFLIGEMVRGEGAILVNRQGERFVDELATRQVVTDGINEQLGSDGYLIFNTELAKRVKAVGFYDHIGLVHHGETLEELAQGLDMPVDTFKTTITKWQEVIARQVDLQFGREQGLIDGFATGPYMAIHIAPAVHYTMGGLKISDLAEVLDANGQPITGLYGAGEVAGGLHGNNRIGGNSITETVVYGLQAAQQIAKLV